jgi:hypothetical protein
MGHSMEWRQFIRRAESPARFEARRLRRFRHFVAEAEEHSPWLERVMAERGIVPETCVPEDFPVMTETEASHPPPETTPVDLATLNDTQPRELCGPASALAALAIRQLDGDLWIRPELITSTGEPLSKLQRQLIERAFGPCLRDVYWSSHLGLMGAREAGDCAMDLQEEDLIFERQKDHTLVTSLRDPQHPIVRYRLDDVIYPGYVARAEDSPRFLNRDGEEDRLPASVLMELAVPGLRRFQMRLNNRTQFELAVVQDPCADNSTADALRAYLGNALREWKMENVCFEITQEEEITAALVAR